MNSNRTFQLLLVLVGIATHLVWFSPFSTITFSDWYYWHDEPVRELWNSWGTWIGFWNTGSQNIQIFFNVFKLCWAALTGLGLSYDSAVKITFLIPISLLGFLSPYYFLRRLIEDNSIAFFGALFYGSTTYFLIRQGAHLPLAWVYSVIPLLFISLQVALKRQNVYCWLIFTLLYSIGIGYEIRIMYIFTLMAVIYFVVVDRRNWRAAFLAAIIVVPLGVMLNSYWMLPTLFGDIGGAISSVANRGLFGNHLFDIVHAMTLHDSSWTGKFPNHDFVKQSVPWYFMLFPILATTALLGSHERSHHKHVLFFALLSVIGIFLTKQAGQPYSGAYLWLYENFPGFNLFREASKFYVITGFGYMGLLIYALAHLRSMSIRLNRPMIFYGTATCYILLIGWQVSPLVTREIRTLFVSRSMPQDYSVMKSWLKTGDQSFYRTLWVPDYSRWSFFTNQHPIVSAVQESTVWTGIFGATDRETKALPILIKETLRQPAFKHYLDLLGIKYIAIPVRDVVNEDDFFKFYGNSREYYIRILDRLDYLKPVEIGAKELKIYENNGSRPRVYTTQTSEQLGRPVPYKVTPFKLVNPAEYEVLIQNMTTPIVLNFSESYHKSWALRIGSFEWGRQFFDADYFMDGQFHEKSDIGLNRFLITPQYVKRTFPPSSYFTNPDGSLTFKLTIFFKPQSYFYLGTIISMVTLFVMLIVMMIKRHTR